MTLGVILAIGESLGDLKSKGQLKRLLDYNIKRYSQAFDHVFIFSYDNEKNFKLPKNCTLVANSLGIHRYLYAFLMPIICYKKIAKCDVLRGLQLSGGIPAVIARIIYGNRFIINYGYDYSKFAKIEGKPLRSFLYKFIEIPIVWLAGSIIVTSIEIKKEFARKLKNSKIHLIPNGVDTNLFRKINQKLKHKFTVLYIGRLERQKNLENLIKALSNFRGTKAVFCGQGSLKNKLKAQAGKLKVDLTIKSPIDYQKIPQAMSAADVFVIPSIEEGNPKILLEAMACQKAVIGSNVKGIKEIIADNYNGLLTEVDPNSIGAAIKKLEDKSLRERLGENARKHILKNYEINSLLDKEVALLKKVAIKK